MPLPPGCVSKDVGEVITTISTYVAKQPGITDNAQGTHQHVAGLVVKAGPVMCQGRDEAQLA